MAKKLWGGRFTKKTDKDFFEFQKSIQYDYKLAEYDVLHSAIHVKALLKIGVLNYSEYQRISQVLNKISAGIKKEKGLRLTSKELNEVEDIHTYIQNKVEKKEKSAGLKLHTLRSRNSQIVFDERYYCLGKSLDIREKLLDVRESILYLIKKYKKEKFIGYTHTQRAQVIYFQHYLLAYSDMFAKDCNRAKTFYDNLDIYISAGALIGEKQFSYDAAIMEIGKTHEKIKIAENLPANISDRDFIIEFLSILAILQMHLSRLAEDLILYSTKEFDFIKLPEEFCTGSSLMPHKKNPDFLELVRGNTGRIYGNLFSVLTMMKGLPLTYNRDMQLDKEPLFSSIETIESELKIMSRFIKGLKLNRENIIRTLHEDVSLYATELATWLIFNKDIRLPAKKAHQIAGKVILLIEKHKGKVQKIGDEELEKLHPALNIEVIKKIMNPEHAILSKKSFSRKHPRRAK